MLVILIGSAIWQSVDKHEANENGSFGQESAL